MYGGGGVNVHSWLWLFSPSRTTVVTFVVVAVPQASVSIATEKSATYVSLCVSECI